MRLITLLSYLLLLPTLSTGQLFQEHLSHDRLSTRDIGHYWVDGELILVMENSFTTSIEGIKGNEAKNVYFQSHYTYGSSTFLTGSDDKTINLYQPWNLDINGFGGVSIRGVDEQSFINYNIGNTPDSYITCIDIKIPYNSPTSECIDQNGTIHIFNSNNELIESKEGLGPLKYYIGNNEEELVIKNGALGTFDNYEFQPRLNLSDTDKIYNNPFTQGYEIINGNKKTSYNASFNITGDYIFDAEPIAIDIKPEAIYFILEIGDGYKIYKNFNEGGTSEYYTIDPTPNGQEFKILDLEVKDLDIYLFGMHTDPITNVSNHMVRKVNILGGMAPSRRNLAITNFSVEKSDPDGDQYYTYEYTIDVKNNGASTVNSFNIYSDLNGFNGLDYTDISKRFDGQLPSGETVTFSGSFNDYSKSKININIPGSDYMLDALPNDNSAEFIFTTSTSDIKSDVTYHLYPNPASNFITLESSTSEISLIGIYDINSKNMNLSMHESTIDIRELKAGRYFIRLKEGETLKVMSFIKI